jgi:murein DD-endopeptidase MepM/ murein hydrolase activator NlpD
VSTEPSTKRGKRSFPKKYLFGIALALLLGTVSTLVLVSSQSKNMQASLAGLDVELDAFPIIEPTLKYGFAIDTFHVVENEIAPNQVLGDLLGSYGVDYPTIAQLVENADGVFDIRHLRVGKPYTILSTDTTQGPDYFIYEPSVYGYYVFELKGDKEVRKVERPIQKEVTVASGVIESSLWQTMVDNGLSYELTAKLEDALQWSIDFHHVQQGDAFKAVFDQNTINDEVVGVGDVHAAYYKNFDNEYYAIWYDGGGKHKGYYDLEGRPMKSTFLRAPVKYSRISSPFNMNRFHPVLRRVKPHLGTDYAAPYGTPIIAVANGVVTKASYTRGNGNYVKIKHDDTYQTQYLHMQGFAKGIRPGVHVKQGQVIGYVGATGLATGPHVCFRFWKNGRQINHRKLTFPPPEPLPEEELPAFFETRDQLLAQLQAVEAVPAPKVAEAPEDPQPQPGL